MKIKELRNQSEAELQAHSKSLKEELLNLRIQQQSGQLENPARIRNLRREVARAQTVISQLKQTAE